MKCDLDCPIPSSVFGRVYCCVGCAAAQVSHVTDENTDRWDIKTGFLGPNGCRLSRDEMPQECKDYDCKNYRFYMCLYWNGKKWCLGSYTPIERSRLDSSFCERYNALLEEYL